MCCLQLKAQQHDGNVVTPQQRVANTILSVKLLHYPAMGLIVVSGDPHVLPFSACAQAYNSNLS